MASAGDDGYYDWDEVNKTKPPELQERPSVARGAADRRGSGRHLALSQRKRHPQRARPCGTTTARTTNSASKTKRPKAPAAEAAAPCSPRSPGSRTYRASPATGCGTKRLDNDIAAVGDPYTGFDIYDSYDCGKTCEEHGGGKGWETMGRHVALIADHLRDVRPRRRQRRGQLPGGDALQPPRPDLVLRRHRRRQWLLRRRTGTDVRRTQLQIR